MGTQARAVMRCERSSSGEPGDMLVTAKHASLMQVFSLFPEITESTGKRNRERLRSTAQVTGSHYVVELGHELQSSVTMYVLSQDTGNTSIASILCSIFTPNLGQCPVQRDVMNFGDINKRICQQHFEIAPCKAVLVSQESLARPCAPSCLQPSLRQESRSKHFLLCLFPFTPILPQVY